MNYISYLLLLILPVNFSGRISNISEVKNPSMQAQEAPTYKVAKLRKSIVTDGNWNKSLWGGIHFRDAIDHGITQGSKIGDWVIGKFEKTTKGRVAVQKSLIQNHY